MLFVRQEISSGFAAKRDEDDSELLAYTPAGRTALQSPKHTADFEATKTGRVAPVQQCSVVRWKRGMPFRRIQTPCPSTPGRIRTAVAGSKVLHD